MNPGDRAYVVLERVRKFLRSMNTMPLDGALKEEHDEVYEDVTGVLFDLDLGMRDSRKKPDTTKRG